MQTITEQSLKEHALCCLQLLEGLACNSHGTEVAEVTAAEAIETQGETVLTWQAAHPDGGTPHPPHHAPLLPG